MPEAHGTVITLALNRDSLRVKNLSGREVEQVVPFGAYPAHWEHMRIVAALEDGHTVVVDTQEAHANKPLPCLLMVSPTHLSANLRVDACHHGPEANEAAADSGEVKRAA